MELQLKETLNELWNGTTCPYTSHIPLFNELVSIIDLTKY